MQKTYFILLVGFYFAFLNSSAQDNYKNFVGIESAVLNVPLKISQDIDSLSFYLTAGYNTELKKAQSVFRWITNNINYDVNKQVTVFKNENDFSQDALRVLRSKKAVCEGYSNLFMELCRRSGLSVEIITGYASAKGDNQTQPHAWNVIKINDEWKLVDATWAAGGIDERNSTYHKSFDPKYFCMNPDSFLRTHYPIDPMWQLIAHPVTYKEFREKVKSQKEFIFSFNDTIAMHSKLL
jgi:transglutaminase/protease-like cytokinesis protein 3